MCIPVTEEFIFSFEHQKQILLSGILWQLVLNFALLSPYPLATTGYFSLELSSGGNNQTFP